MKPALLVIDVQKRYFNDTTRRSLESAIEYINAAIALFRQKSLPVVCIQHRRADDVQAPSADDFGSPDALAVLQSDRQFVKTHGNAFKVPELLPYLQQLGVDTLIVTGFCAEYCVLSTYRGAQDCGLSPIILRGSLASDTPENIRFVESISDLISFGALAKMLENF